jgi:carboxypeptidase C (cathepsin A)
MKLIGHRYLDVGHGKDLFFYFFESRSKPSEDPVVMWINGGPGASFISTNLTLRRWSRLQLGPWTVHGAVS